VSCLVALSSEHGSRSTQAAYRRWRSFTRSALVFAALLTGFASLTASSAQASFPGLPGLIALQRSANPDESDIWVFDSHTGAAQQLTHGAYDTGPVFSPDGEWIAFSSDASKYGYLNIWAIRPDGTGLHRLTFTGRDLEADEPAFSADGRWVAFSAEAPRGGYEIDRVPVGGGQPKVLIPGSSASSAVRPSYSPDGRHLTWVQGPEVLSGGAQPHINIGNLSGHGARALTRGSDPEFSPDGQSIVFVRERRCASGRTGEEVDTLSLVTKQVSHLVQSCSAQLSGPSYSPDGSWIAYTVLSGTRSRLGFIAVPGMTPSFTPPAGLGADLPVDQAPSWQPLSEFR
jgi:Tol biopolymer transport system component